MKKLAQSFAILAATLSFCAMLILGLAKPVYADGSAMDAMKAILKEVKVKDGAFEVKVSTPIHPPGDQPLVVRKALVSLSPETLQQGVVNSIKITGPDGIEFGCVNLKVKQGTDLVKSCGGPAILKKGMTTYEANGSGFGPATSGTFSISLIP